MKLAAASKVLAAFRGNVEKPYGMQAAADAEDDALRHSLLRVCALHSAPDGRSKESSAEEVVTSGNTSAQPSIGCTGRSRAHR